MPLNADFMFESKQITPPLSQALGLPRDVWYLVLDDRLGHAYFMDTDYEIHHQSISGDVRLAVEEAVKSKAPAPRQYLPYRKTRLV